eukprot:UN05053
MIMMKCYVETFSRKLIDFKAKIYIFADFDSVYVGKFD